MLKREFVIPGRVVSVHDVKVREGLDLSASGVHTVINSPARYVFTSATFSYQDKVLTLARSIKENSPGFRFVWLVVEDSSVAREKLLTKDLRPRYSDIDEILFLDQLLDPPFEDDLRGQSVVEACTSVKGAAFLALLLRPDCRDVTYLDPDICVYSDLSTALEGLETHQGLVTPHLVRPATSSQGVLDNEVAALKHGVYNLGFLSLSATRAGVSIARWWADRLSDLCIDDPARGLFTDQRWFDLAVALFPEIGVVRHPGCNVATWNLETRHLRRERGQYFVNGYPLVFAHYSAVSSGAHDVMLNRYSQGDTEFKSLSDEYKATTRRHADLEITQIPWTLGSGGLKRPNLRKLKIKSSSWLARRRSVLGHSYVRLRSATPPSLLPRLESGKAYILRQPLFHRAFPEDLAPKPGRGAALPLAQKSGRPTHGGRRHLRSGRTSLASALEAHSLTKPTLGVSHFGGGGTEVVARSLLNEVESSFLMRASRAGNTEVIRVADGLVVWRLPARRRSSLGAEVLACDLEAVLANHALGNEDWLMQLTQGDFPLTVVLNDRYWLTQFPFWYPGVEGVLPHGIAGVDRPLNQARVPDSAERWTQRWADLISGAHRVLAPSHDIAQDFVHVSAREVVVSSPYHSTMRKENPLSPFRHTWTGSTPLYIAAVNATTPWKGSQDLVALSSQLSKLGVEHQIHVFGDAHPLWPPPKGAQIVNRGYVARETLVHKLATEPFHLALFPSQVPESYCLAVDDAYHAGLMPVARAIGALEEHLSNLGVGLVWDGPLDGGRLLRDLQDLSSGGRGDYLRAPSVPPKDTSGLIRQGAWSMNSG